MLGGYFIFAAPANAEYGSYNYWLAALSLVVAVFAARTAFNCTAWVISLPAKSRMMGRLTGAIALGCGIWGMHFIGMLACKMRMRVQYDPVLTILSIILAMAAAYYALRCVDQKKMTRRQIWQAALVLGFVACIISAWRRW